MAALPKLMPLESCLALAVHRKVHVAQDSSEMVNRVVFILGRPSFWSSWTVLLQVF
jgi:hypothetical protein